MKKDIFKKLLLPTTIPNAAATQSLLCLSSLFTDGLYTISNTDLEFGRPCLFSTLNIFHLNSANKGFMYNCLVSSPLR